MIFPEEINRIRKARIRLLREFPFFGTLALNLTLDVVDDDSKCPTAQVSSSGKLTFGRDFLSKLSDPELAWVLTHEVLHPALFYWQRQGHRKVMAGAPYTRPDGTKGMHRIPIWNLAHDYAINLIIEEEIKSSRQGWITRPKLALYNEKYRDLPAETIYEMLLEEIPEDLEGFSSDVVEDSQGPTAGEDTTWKNAILNAARAQAQSGRPLPNAIKSLISEMVNPKVSWQDQLSQWVGDVLGKMDFSYRRPSRRAESTGEILSICSPQGLPHVVILWDTSGSMDGQQTSILSEILEIIEVSQAPLRVITCDAAVHGDVTSKDAEEIVEIVKGGGGSDFCPAFEVIKTTMPTDRVIIAVTDGMISVPDEAPQAQAILWLLTEGGADPTNGKWGTVIHMNG